jgi:hypothetical protein
MKEGENKSSQQAGYCNRYYKNDFFLTRTEELKGHLTKKSTMQIKNNHFFVTFILTIVIN